METNARGLRAKWVWVNIKEEDFELRYAYDTDTNTDLVQVYKDDLLGNYKFLGQIWGLQWFPEVSENGEYDEFIYQVENWLDNNYF